MNQPCKILTQSLSALAIMGILPAYAQTTPATPVDDDTIKLEKFVVTGSYIPSVTSAFDAGTSPVVNIDRRVIDQSGFTTAGELLQKINISNGGAVPISNNATGFTPAASSISLRGLGPEATLVLINGRRVAVYPKGTGGTTAFVDLNSIPLAAIDSIEVLKDGASALYGADAVAGVVNIKLRKFVDGTEAMVSYGNTTNEDSSETVASFVTGAKTAQTSVLVGANYFKKNAIFNRDRDYSQVPPFLSSNSSPLNLQVSRLAVNAALGQAPGSSVTGVNDTQNFGTTANPDIGPRTVFFTQSGATSANNGQRPANQYIYSNGRSSTFNFNEFSGAYPSSERMGVFASGERAILGTENVRAYIDINYQNVRTENQLAPSATGDFSTPGQTEQIIPANTPNPILTVIDRTSRAMTQVTAGSTAPVNSIAGPGTRIVGGVVQRIAPAGAFNPFNPYNQDIAGGSRARLAEFGNRIYRNETSAFLLTTGVKADNLFEKWVADLAYSYSRITDNSRNTLDSSSRLNRLFNAADSYFQPGSPDYTGQTTPYNPFGYYRVPIATNQSLTNVIKVDVKDYNISDLGQVTFNMATGDLFEIPAGSVGLAFGGDYRQEKISQFPDPFGASGDLIGSSPDASTKAQRKIAGFFIETKVPLLKEAPAAHSLTLEAALRHEMFMTSDREATVPKLGLRWQPIDETLTIRSTWSQGFREPSLYELYSTPTAALEAITDPRTGLREPEQPITTAGNRRLEAEETESFNVGFIYSPEAFAKGLNLGINFWRIERDGTVSDDPQSTLNRFVGRTPSGALASGGLLPGESVVLLPDGSVNQVNSVFFNLGVTKVQGYDFEASYVLTTNSAGIFELSTSWTFLDSYKQTLNKADPLVELVGEDVDFISNAGEGQDGYLEWRGRVQLQWAYNGINFLIGTNYTDGFRDFDADANEFQVASTWIYDAQVSYTFSDRQAAWLRGSKITLGARNLFDEDPPFASGFAGNSAGYPTFLYNSEGQFYYLSLEKQL